MVYLTVGLSGSGSARGGSAKLVYPEIQKGSKPAGSGSARGGSAEHKAVGLPARGVMAVGLPAVGPQNTYSLFFSSFKEGNETRWSR